MKFNDQNRSCHAEPMRGVSPERSEWAQGNSAKHLAAQRARSFAALRMTSDPRALPILVGKNHYRRWAQTIGPTDRLPAYFLDTGFYCV
jgi:hypothetical protein